MPAISHIETAVTGMAHHRLLLFATKIDEPRIAAQAMRSRLLDGAADAPATHTKSEPKNVVVHKKKGTTASKPEPSQKSFLWISQYVSPAQLRWLFHHHAAVTRAAATTTRAAHAAPRRNVDARASRRSVVVAKNRTLPPRPSAVNPVGPRAGVAFRSMRRPWRAWWGDHRRQALRIYGLALLFAVIFAPLASGKMRGQHPDMSWWDATLTVFGVVLAIGAIFAVSVTVWAWQVDASPLDPAHNRDRDDGPQHR